MSSDFTKILVKDDRMECVDNIKYAVIKGGQNVTPSQFRAISTSNNQLVFNIQVPSEQTLIDRRVLLQTDLTLVVTSQQAQWAAGNDTTVINTDSAAATNGCGYGTIAGLAPYPLHQMMTVASATINNNTVSINMKDVLPAIIRMLDKEELGSYNGTTVSQTDTFLSYADTLFNASPAQGSVGTIDTSFSGRGSMYLKNYSMTTANLSTFPITIETFTWHISEPLMLSPFIYCNPKSNGQAFYGIQNMNIVLNIGSDLSRVFRGCQYINGLPTSVFPLSTNTTNETANYSLTNVYPSPAGAIIKNGNTWFPGTSLPYILSVAPGSDASTSSMFSNTYLLFTFLTAHPSDLYPARNIVPYYELPRYITTSSASAPISVVGVATGTNHYASGIDTTAGTLLTSQTLQLNQIPDKLLMFIRKQGQGVGDSDAYLPITKISIDFNNNSGLLSAARSEDLYRMAKDNGSNQNWNEWVGFQSCTVGGLPTSLNGGASNTSCGLNIPSPVVQPLSGTQVVSPSFTAVPTCGGVCVLEFGKDIQLIEDFFAPGSLGNFNIRVNIYYNNNSPSLLTGSAIELVMITMNSGVFVCERGTSSTYTGILTRADVLEASEQDAYTRSDVKRMVGGGFLDMLKSGVSKLAPLAKAVAPHVMPHAKEFLSSKGALGKLASQGIGAMGYGMSGGGGSGGRLHGRYV